VQVLSSVSVQFSAVIAVNLNFGVWKKDGTFLASVFEVSRSQFHLFPLCEFSTFISEANRVFRRDRRKIAQMKTTEPNQALEPTTTAVTDRAGARSAPAAVAAHH
jgi:hypothetical protein